MYTIFATFSHGATACCRCDTCEELVNYLVEWLPMALKIECREVREEE